MLTAHCGAARFRPPLKQPNEDQVKDDIEVEIEEIAANNQVRVWWSQEQTISHLGLRQRMESQQYITNTGVTTAVFRNPEAPVASQC